MQVDENKDCLKIMCVLGSKMFSYSKRKQLMISIVFMVYLFAFINKQIVLNYRPTKYRNILARNSLLNTDIHYIAIRYNSSESRRALGDEGSRTTVNLEEMMTTNFSDHSVIEVSRYIANMMTSPTAQCRKTVNLGGRGYCSLWKSPVFDGFKSVCLDEPVRPKSKRCVALSFGIGHEFSFDDAMAAYGCKVFSFDFTMTNWTNTYYGYDRHFLNIAIGHSNKFSLLQAVIPGGNNSFLLHTTRMTFSRILQLLDLTHTKIDYLKMDIENNEWDVFLEIMNSKEGSSILKRVQQIMIEIHLDHLLHLHTDPDYGLERTFQVLDVLLMLTKSGFRLVHWTPNTQTQTIVRLENFNIFTYTELHFIRVFKNPR